MSQSIDIRSIEEIDIRKEIDGILTFAKPGAIFDSEKVRNRIARKYRLYLDDHETRSFGRSIGFVLTEMYESGILDVYSDTRPITYVRLKAKGTSFITEVHNYSD